MIVWSLLRGAARRWQPVEFDVTQPEAAWPATLRDSGASFDVVLAANLIHIAPFGVCEALVAAAAAKLRVGGFLVLYGPFRVAGSLGSASNAEFDAALRARDPAFGVRDVEAVDALAAARSLE